MIRMYRYSGAGNSFVVIDGRDVEIPRFRKPETIHALCLLNGTDGLMILDKSDKADFRMEYFNSDGSGGMMCGNGGRCIVAFADLVGVKAFHSTEYCFEAADGLHRATILSHLGECKIVRLQMCNVRGVAPVLDGFFLNTGTRHFVKFVDDVSKIDIDAEAPAYRHNPAFAPEGANVNFVSANRDGSLSVRTFEKGVEAETLSCGTGITASALAAFHNGIPASVGTGGTADSPGTFVRYVIHSLQDTLEVDFKPAPDGSFSDLFLTGPTLCEGEIF